MRFQCGDWKGRYSRISGDASVLRLKWADGRYRTSIYWNRDDEIATCIATDSTEEMALAGAVAKAKRTMGGNGGGSFQINEFGQAIVPSSRDGMRRLLVGEISGKMQFEYPGKKGSQFDLSDVGGYDSGDIWKRPYIGMRFNLSKGSKIYCWQEGREGDQSFYPDRQDEKLIRELRAIRSWGPVRFIVNPWGIALTKRPPQDVQKGEEAPWVPVYVGRIDPRNWFNKEI